MLFRSIGSSISLAMKPPISSPPVSTHDEDVLLGSIPMEDLDVVINPKAQTIAGLEALDSADLAILFIRRMTLPEEQLAQFKKFAASGKPIIGLRTASHAFENWKEWDRDVLGGNYQNHHNNQLATTVRAAPEAAGHPILKGGPKEFASPGSLYRNSPLPDGATVLLMGSVEGKPAEPVAWTRRHGSASGGWRRPEPAGTRCPLLFRIAECLFREVSPCEGAFHSCRFFKSFLER